MDTKFFLILLNISLLQIDYDSLDATLDKHLVKFSILIENRW